MISKTTTIKLATMLVCCYVFPAQADCIRSCEANIFVKLSYQPAGDTNTVRKTHALKTLVSKSRDGSSGRTCVAHNIFTAKNRACTAAATDLSREYSSQQQRQMEAVCNAVQYDKGSFDRAKLGFPTAADWYSIDEIWAYGKRDLAKHRTNIRRNGVRFSCNEGTPSVYTPGHAQPAQQSAAASEGAAPPPPPTLRTGESSGNGAAPPPPPTLRTGESNGRKPDLYISEFQMTPATPVKGQPVHIRIGVYNKGSAQAGAFTVKWWPGENYPNPACSWNINKMNARGGRILQCTYTGYPSWYGRINTKVMADTNNQVAESDEGNNVLKKTISVSR